MSGENETVKLIRCYVKNQNDEKSLRYIDMESYNLWQHIMISKHGFEICDKALCLWVNEAEFLKKQMIYVSAGEIECRLLSFDWIAEVRWCSSWLEASDLDGIQ